MEALIINAKLQLTGNILFLEFLTRVHIPGEGIVRI